MGQQYPDQADRCLECNPACPASHPYDLTANSVEDGRMCWATALGADAGDDTSVTCCQWCLLPEYETLDPGGHLTRCPNSVCPLPAWNSTGAGCGATSCAGPFISDVLDDGGLAGSTTNPAWFKVTDAQLLAMGGSN